MGAAPTAPGTGATGTRGATARATCAQTGVPVPWSRAAQSKMATSRLPASA